MSKWECKGCTNCCQCLGSLAYVEFPEELRSEVVAKVGENTRYAILRGPLGGFLLAMHGSGTPCVFLSEGRCSIWERRPARCVEYPQGYIGRMSEEQLQARAKTCPGMREYLNGR